MIIERAISYLLKAEIVQHQEFIDTKINGNTYELAIYESTLLVTFRSMILNFRKFLAYSARATYPVMVTKLQIIAHWG